MHVLNAPRSWSYRKQSLDGEFVPPARSVRSRGCTTTVNRICAGTVCLQYQRNRSQMSVLGGKMDRRFARRCSRRWERAFTKQQRNYGFVSILRGKVQGGPSPSVFCRASRGFNQVRGGVNLSPKLEQCQAQWYKPAISSYDSQYDRFDHF